MPSGGRQENTFRGKRVYRGIMEVGRGKNVGGTGGIGGGVTGGFGGVGFSGSRWFLAGQSSGWAVEAQQGKNCFFA